MNKNGMRQTSKEEVRHIGCESNSELVETCPSSHVIDYNGETVMSKTPYKKEDISASESLLRMEDHKKQIESTEIPARNATLSSLNAVIDRGNFNANVSGGAAREIVECSSLPNGDIVVLLQVNIGVDILRDPVLEILQFERSYSMSSLPQNTTPPILPAKTPSSKPDFNLEDWDSSSNNKVKESLQSLSENRFRISALIPNLPELYIQPRETSQTLRIVQIEFDFALDQTTTF
ncbi:hypothetical protein QQ045_009451 [Rhodiola kirilowii]